MLPDGKAFATDTSDDFLKAPVALLPDEALEVKSKETPSILINSIAADPARWRSISCLGA